MTTRILILGAGGIGGLLGARLVAAGAEVSFLLRPHRAIEVRRNGLRLISPHGDALVAPVVVEQAAAQADLIILACKGHDLDAALQAIAPAVTQGTAILPFLNGVRHLDNICRCFPMAQLWGGVAQVGVTMAADGTIHHLGQECRFLIGPLDRAPTGPGLALQSALAFAPVEIEVSPDILAEMWLKFVHIGTLAGATSLCRSRMRAILSLPEGRSTVRRLHAECRAIACAEHPGLAIEAMDADLTRMTDRLCDSGSSMMRDLLAGLPTEHDHLLGDLVIRAGRHRVDAPLLSACLAALAVQDTLRRAATSNP